MALVARFNGLPIPAILLHIVIPGSIMSPLLRQYITGDAITVVVDFSNHW